MNQCLELRNRERGLGRVNITQYLMLLSRYFNTLPS